MLVKFCQNSGEKKTKKAANKFDEILLEVWRIQIYASSFASARMEAKMSFSTPVYAANVQIDNPRRSFA